MNAAAVSRPPMRAPFAGGLVEFRDYGTLQHRLQVPQLRPGTIRLSVRAICSSCSGVGGRSFMPKLSPIPH